MLDMEKARFNMIEQQIRPCEVFDGRILDLLKHVRREHYVPKDKIDMAFMDMEIPLGRGAYMWRPSLEAKVLQELHLRHGDKVLEVGTGSGYLTALLATMTKHVTSVDIVPELTAGAQLRLHAYHHGNVTLETGDAARGWGGGERYDVIVLTASTPVLPRAFQDSLNVGGRMFAIVGDAPVMEARLITRISQDAFEAVNLLETCVAPLQNAMQPERFVF